MNDFVLILRSKEQLSTEKLQEQHKYWREWFGKLAAEGKLSRSVQSFDNDGRIVGRDDLVASGLYTEVREAICGLLVIKASSYDEAVEIARECPILELGGNVEIRMGM